MGKILFRRTGHCVSLRRSFKFLIGIRFVVDASDAESFSMAREELHALLAKPRLGGIPLLVLANKNDLPTAASVETIIKEL